MDVSLWMVACELSTDFNLNVCVWVAFIGDMWMCQPTRSPTHHKYACTHTPTIGQNNSKTNRVKVKMKFVSFCVLIVLEAILDLWGGCNACIIWFRCIVIVAGIFVFVCIIGGISIVGASALCFNFRICIFRRGFLFRGLWMEINSFERKRFIDLFCLGYVNGLFFLGGIYCCCWCRRCWNLPYHWTKGLLFLNEMWDLKPGIYQCNRFGVKPWISLVWFSISLRKSICLFSTASHGMASKTQIRVFTHCAMNESSKVLNNPSEPIDGHVFCPHEK